LDSHFAIETYISLIDSQSMNTSSRSSATAGILAEFLPIYDKMNDLNNKYAEDDFGSKYSGLSLAPTFAKMGVTEYEVSPGEPLDRIRMMPKGSEHSSEFQKDTVITALSSGMALEGNVIRPVDCIVSLGAKTEKDKADDEEESEDEGEAKSSEEESSQ
jgi:molecular chaperone GrpE (heat shock protein)